MRRSGYFRRMVLVGFVVALELIFYFASIRLANVTVGVSLEYMAPVFVALLAPWVLRTRRQGIDMVAVAVAVGGMALLVVPGLTLGEGRTSIPGIVCGLLAGLMFATAMMLIKSMGAGRPRHHVRAVLLRRQRRAAHPAGRVADDVQRTTA